MTYSAAVPIGVSLWVEDNLGKMARNCMKITKSEFKRYVRIFCLRQQKRYFKVSKYTDQDDMQKYHL